MNRRDLFRRTLIGTAAAALPRDSSAREFPPGQDASKDLARNPWTPVFFDDHQNQTLIAFSDILIPETAAPGAKSALVNRFLDRLLAVESPENQRDFLSSLAYLDAESSARHQSSFADLSAEQQRSLVALMASANEDTSACRNFARLKDWISRGYYNSEAGLQSLTGGASPLDCNR